ncbi:hypothetical protein QFC24_000657 [Naganishia onofrii]|uniref:Uncharacterized protein n=1 Tax=Naganishia onofrii TaxID=1851511 RepID=A0ACC2XWH6_9TREE|nr:hypothetical protein QFC24_000657 [Naganishia onofrii]
MAKSKGSRGGGRGTGSFFTNLPSELKSQLRSQTFSEAAASPQPLQQSDDTEATMPSNKRRKLSQGEQSMALIPTQPGTGKDEADTTISSISGVAQVTGKESWDCTGHVPRYTNHAEMPENIKKYFLNALDFYQRNELFSLYASHNILMDETGWFSVTPESIACHIAERCQSDTILDPFCGVGGNVIQFAMTCERDNDMTRLKLARHNAMQYGVADRIEFICADYIQFAEAYAKRLDQDAKAGRSRHGDEIDVVFLSPPWGGTDYLSLGKSTTLAETPQTSARKGKGKQTNDSGLDYLGTSTDTPFSSTPTNSGRAKPETYGVPNEMPPYPLSALAPVSGKEIFELTSRISPNIAFYLPKNTDTNELAALAPDIVDESGKVVGKEWVEIEEEYVGQRKGWNSLKAITAYYGGIVASEE